ncbi:MAG: hypothetical protein LBL95_03740, partial [Deltaproteobacteria bacterium]|nr:hypothetical protein [Deltaproteobacteria bacterium]
MLGSIIESIIVLFIGFSIIVFIRILKMPSDFRNIRSRGYSPAYHPDYDGIPIPPPPGPFSGSNVTKPPAPLGVITATCPRM